MATEVIKDLFLTQYKDDYKDSDNYYQILFNSGRGLQSRELNQLQTILNQDNAAALGAIYRSGAPLSGGLMDVEQNVKFVKLNTTTYSLPADLTTITGETFATTTGIKIRLIKAVAATGSDPATIFVQILDSNGQTPTDVTTALDLTPRRHNSYWCYNWNCS